MPNAEKQSLVIRSEGLVPKRLPTHANKKPVAIRVIIWNNGQGYTVTAKSEIMVAAGIVRSDTSDT